MCEQTNGKEVVFEERLAWKLVTNLDYTARQRAGKFTIGPPSGPWYWTRWQPDGWSVPVTPVCRKIDTRREATCDLKTASGYHVFRTRANARARLRNSRQNNTYIARVMIRGKALPFWGFGDGGILEKPTGWAVEQWRPLPPRGFRRRLKRS